MNRTEGIEGRLFPARPTSRAVGVGRTNGHPSGGQSEKWTECQFKFQERRTAGRGLDCASQIPRATSTRGQDNSYTVHCLTLQPNENCHFARRPQKYQMSCRPHVIVDLVSDRDREGPYLHDGMLYVGRFILTFHFIVHISFNESCLVFNFQFQNFVYMRNLFLFKFCWVATN